MRLSLSSAPTWWKASGAPYRCEPGLGVPIAEQRLELMRAALLRVRDLHARHGIDFRAMPELAILTRPCAEPR
jgi:hypothetical protein